MASVCVFVRFYPHFSLHHELEVCDVFCDHEHDREYLNGEVDEDVGKSYDRMLRDKIKHGRLIIPAMMMIMTMTMMLTGSHHSLVPPKMVRLMKKMTNLTTDLSHPKANSAPLSIGPHVFHTIHCTIIYIQRCA